MCFVVFCGVLRCFAGVLRVFCGVLQVFFEKQCFAVFCGCFAMFWTCFAYFFFRHFLSERKMHSTVLRCCTKRILLFVLCRVLYTFWSVLCCFVKNAKNTHTKHHKTPQNTVFEKHLQSC